MKEVTVKLDLLNIENFCSAKDSVKRMKRQAPDWRKYLQKTCLLKDYYSKYTKNSWNSTLREWTAQFKNRQKTWTDTSRKKIHRWQVSIWKNAPHHMSSGKCKLKQQWGTSLVVQWLRICLPLPGTRVWALLWEDPTCCRTTKPVRHSYWSYALEPANHSYWNPHA